MTRKGGPSNEVDEFSGTTRVLWALPHLDGGGCNGGHLNRVVRSAPDKRQRNRLPFDLAITCHREPLS